MEDGEGVGDGGRGRGWIGRIGTVKFGVISFIRLIRKKNHIFWHNSGAVATITQPQNNLLSRYIAGFISDNN